MDERKYALREKLNGNLYHHWSTGGVWRNTARTDDCLMTFDEALALQKRHPHAQITDVPLFELQVDLWNRGFASVIPRDFEGKTTHAMRSAAREAGYAAVIAAGHPRETWLIS